MKRRLRVALIGFGKLGRACAQAIRDTGELELAGIVRRSSLTLPSPFAHLTSVEHIRDLRDVQLALVCVPPKDSTAVALELLQGRMRTVECAQLSGQAREAHYAAIEAAARRHRVAAVVGAGWDPGALTVMQALFDLLIPHGQSSLTRHPGLTLHHSAHVENIAGVQEALIGEFRTADRIAKHYVYLRLHPHADANAVRQAVQADPLFGSETTEVFVLPDFTALEAPAGVVLERRGSTGASHSHSALSLDACFDVCEFAAQAMLDAARSIAYLQPGAYRYALGPISLSTVSGAQ